jgi:hypothetical protein
MVLAVFISLIALCMGGISLLFALDTGSRQPLPMVPWDSVITFISPVTL